MVAALVAQLVTPATSRSGTVRGERSARLWIEGTTRTGCGIGHIRLTVKVVKTESVRPARKWPNTVQHRGATSLQESGFQIAGFPFGSLRFSLMSFPGPV